VVLHTTCAARDVFQVIDTTAHFKQRGPQCVLCREGGPQMEYGKEGERGLLYFARQQKAVHRHWPWPVGKIG
jgi:hypothetical protein